MSFPRILAGIGTAFYVVACALLTGAALYLPALGFLQHARLHEGYAGLAMPIGAAIGGPLAFWLRHRTWPCAVKPERRAGAPKVRRQTSPGQRPGNV